jgi:hypothetical protein
MGPSSRVVLVGLTLSFLVLGYSAGCIETADNDNGNGDTPEPPKAKVSVDSEDIFEGNRINFSARDSTGDLKEYQWDFGDGSEGYGVTASHKYDEVGEYRVRLTVIDNRGESDSDSHFIHVHYRDYLSSKVSVSQKKSYGIPIEEYAQHIKVILTYPTGSVIGGLPSNDLDVELYYPNGSLYLSSNKQEPDTGNMQEEELHVPTQELMASFYRNWKVEVKADKGIEVDFELAIEVNY